VPFHDGFGKRLLARAEEGPALSAAQEFRPPYPHWCHLSALTLPFHIRKVSNEALYWRVRAAFCEAAGGRSQCFKNRFIDPE
jgi:hypothetical protein